MEETETVQGIENINILKGVRKDTASIKQEILKKKKKGNSDMKKSKEGCEIRLRILLKKSGKKD